MPIFIVVGWELKPCLKIVKAMRPRMACKTLWVAHQNSVGYNLEESRAST